MSDRSSELEAFQLVNVARSGRGLAVLARGRLLSRYARRHADRMLRGGELYHGDVSRYFATKHMVWGAWGENVGATGDRGDAVRALHTGFMASPDHKANILGKFNRVGIGLATDGAITFETQVFMR